MFVLPDTSVQSVEEVMQTVNDSVENIKFRIMEYCTSPDEMHCDQKSKCDLFKDCYDFSSKLSDNSDLLSMVLNHPILNRKLVDIFKKLIPDLQLKIASYGDFKTKTKTEIDFLSQILVQKESKAAGYMFDRKGAANHVLGNYPVAVECFDEAIKLMKDNPSVYFRRGESKYRMVMFAEADDDFNKAMELNEFAPEENKLDSDDLATTTLRLGNLEAAKSDFLRVVKLKPDHPGANGRLGEIYGRSDENLPDLEKAIEYFSKSIHSDSNQLETRHQLAVALYNVSIIIGGNTFLQYSSVERQQTHKQCDDASSHASISYCERGLEQVDWLINRINEDYYITSGSKDLKLSQLYTLKSKLLKMIGDNTFTKQTLLNTSKMRKDAVATLDSFKHDPVLKYKVEQLIDDILNFKKQADEIQQLRAVNIMQNFNELISATTSQRREERRKICTAAADFFASIGSFKTAEQFISKLESLESRLGFRDTLSYCDEKRNIYNDMKHELQKKRVNADALMYYIESEKSIETAIQLSPSGELYHFGAVICLCIADFIEKLKPDFLDKAFAYLKAGKEIEPESKVFPALLMKLKEAI